MLGSVHDAGDALQDTLLRAWKGIGGFAGRSSLRRVIADGGDGGRALPV
jgi:DNA-directed RNA polymerase specialized sigma24 family protein